MSFVPMILGGVLAGGLSRRMDGVDKNLMILGEVSMIERAVSRLSPQVSQIVINANGDLERFSNMDVPTVCDLVGGFAGPLAGIHALMAYANRCPENYSHIVTVAADTPFFPIDVVEKLAESQPIPQIVLAKSGGYKHPVFGLWSIDLLEPLERFLHLGETRKVMAFVHDHDYSLVEFDFFQQNGESLDPFFNINNPQDLIMAQGYFREWPDHVG